MMFLWLFVLVFTLHDACGRKNLFGSHLEIGSAAMRKRSRHANTTAHVSNFMLDTLQLRKRQGIEAQRLRGAMPVAPESSEVSKTDRRNENPSQDEHEIEHEIKTASKVHVAAQELLTEADLSSRVRIPIATHEGLDLQTLDIVMHALKAAYLCTFGTTYKEGLAKKLNVNKVLLQRGFPTKRGGWLRHPELDSNPAEGVNGMHGVVFTNDFKQAIIAIRGTDWAPEDKCVAESGCRADLCADKKLWDIPHKVIDMTDLPKWCYNESAAHDYPAETTYFVKHVLKALPEHDVLLVGHSLGGGLALIAGAEIMREATLPDGKMLQVVAVAPPPYALNLGEQQLDDSFLVIYDMLDPILYATMHRGGFQGTEPMCYSMEHNNQALISSCTADCIPGVMNREKPAEFGTVWPAGKCDSCFPSAHSMRSYLVSSSDKKHLERCDSLMTSLSSSGLVNFDQTA